MAVEITKDTALQQAEYTKASANSVGDQQTVFLEDHYTATLEISQKTKLSSSTP